MSAEIADFDGEIRRRLASDSRVESTDELLGLLVKIARSGTEKQLGERSVQVLELEGFTVTGMDMGSDGYFVRVDSDGAIDTYTGQIYFSAYARTAGEHQIMTWRWQKTWEVALYNRFCRWQANQ